MSGFKKPAMPRQSSYNSLYVNPLNQELKHTRNSSESELLNKPCVTTLGELHRRQSSQSLLVSDDKENVYRKPILSRRSRSASKENVVPLGVSNSLGNERSSVHGKLGKCGSKSRELKASSLQLCVQMNEPDLEFKLKVLEPLVGKEELSLKGDSKNSKTDIWDYSDSEAAPASSWSILPNRSLLCRPLPLDIGRCTCVIVKESLPAGLYGGSLYSFYTNEGQGRKDRKLAVAYQRRRNGRSEFSIAQKEKGLLCSSDDSFLGSITSNFMGSKYHIWDQGSAVKSVTKKSKLLAVVGFVPTLTTCTGSHRRLTAWIPRHQSMQLKSTNQVIILLYRRYSISMVCPRIGRKKQIEVTSCSQEFHIIILFRSVMN